ncbi:MAG: hypothetical protein OEY34_02150, partial [Cyclobacteriaceae bacterium]|nr:hypothetical protein [Cyclobacteriaceae bacterium]
LQQVNAVDMNRVAGSELTDSAFAALLTAIQATIGNTGELIVMGFKVLSQTSTTFELGPGVILATNGIFKFPGKTFTPDPSGLWGKYEYRLVTELGEPAIKQYFDVSTRNFTPDTGPSRKIHRFEIREKFETTAVEPAITSGFYPLFQYKRAIPDGALTELKYLTTIQNSGDGLNGSTIQADTINNQQMATDVKIGSLAALVAGITDNASVTDALNFLYNFSQSKNFIRTIPDGGYDDTIFRVRTSGNYAWWDRGDGVFRPFA